MIKIIKNQMFWIGAMVTNLLYAINNFITGDFTWKFTTIIGVINILSIGVASMNLERENK
jgi:hypothetical protein